MRELRGLLVIFLAAALATLSLAGCEPGAGTDTGGEPSAVVEQTTEGAARSYPVVDTGQVKCYDNMTEIAAPAEGQAFYGQNAQYNGSQPSYKDNGDGTVTDNVTGLIWQQDPGEKKTYAAAVAEASALDLAGYNDWRLPTIKELYSLIDFSGTDPSGMQGNDTSGLTPFIDTDFFKFVYGDVTGERVIDSQYASCTLYAANSDKLFGVNFADGRIKGYDLTMPGGRSKTFFVMYVRGDTGYDLNSFTDNGDGTVTDAATRLTWSQADSGQGLNWQEALAWVQQKNSANYLGYSDWRLPDAKELQGIVDYTRSPDTTSSAAIDPVFSCTSITNEAVQADYPFYWTSTTHASSNGSGGAAAYVAFGRALGYMNGRWVDVHGAGAQRSDPKAGDPAAFSTGRGPQGDDIRIYNYVRLVRG